MREGTSGGENLLRLVEDDKEDIIVDSFESVDHSLRRSVEWSKKVEFRSNSSDLDSATIP
jgi:hypothetical protein